MGSHGRRHERDSAEDTQTSAGSKPSASRHSCPPRPPHLHLPSSGSHDRPVGQSLGLPSEFSHCAPPWHCKGGVVLQTCSGSHAGAPGPPHLHSPSVGSQVWVLGQFLLTHKT